MKTGTWADIATMKNDARGQRRDCARKPLNHAGLYVAVRNDFPVDSSRFAPQAAFGQREICWTAFATLLVSLLCLTLK